MRLTTAVRPAIAAPPSPLFGDVVFASRRMFLQHTLVGSAACRFLWPGGVGVRARTPVCLRVRFEGEPEVFAVEGTVLRSYEVIRSVEHSGATVEVTGAQVPAFARVYAHARGQPLELGRRHSTRFAVARPALIEVEGTELPVHLRDLSRGGACVMLPLPHLNLPRQSRLTFRVGFLRRLTVEARTVWLRRSASSSVLGLEFVAMNAQTQAALAAYTARLALEQPARGH
jgi:hypothetical protein